MACSRNFRLGCAPRRCCWDGWKCSPYWFCLRPRCGANNPWIVRPRMSRIEHVAIWTEDLERLAEFYAKYFGAIAGDKYVNPTKGFESRFLSFAGGARIEVMKSSVLDLVKYELGAQRIVLRHLACS